MKGEHSFHNKIIPVKSLVEANKHQAKKHHIQSASKESNHPSLQFSNTSKNGHQNNKEHIVQQPLPENFVQNGPAIREIRERIKGISIGKNYSVTKVSIQNGLKETPQKGYRPYEQFFYTAKKEISGCHETINSARVGNYLSGRLKKQGAGHNPRISQIVQPEESYGFLNGLNEKREYFKSVSLNGFSDELSKDSSRMLDNFSGKLQDQTWNVSKFDKITLNEKESHPIFKDQMTKIKTQLFQKQACLFTVTQKLQQKQIQNKQLNKRLQAAVDLGKGLKIKLNQFINQIKQQGTKNQAKQNLIQIYETEKQQFLSQIQSLKGVIDKLNEQVKKSKQKQNQQDENNATETKLMQLKMKQHEIQEKKQVQYILELKEKERRNTQSFQKLLNVQKELLRQKEEQLIQISQTAQFYKEQSAKNNKQLQQMKDKNKCDDSGKEEVIRQLSGEVGDMKVSLKNLQIQMRELIQNEQQLKKQIQIKKLLICELQDKNVSLTNEVEQLNKECKIYSDKFTQIQSNSIIKINQLASNVTLRQFQLSMMSKTCEQYKKKIDDYHRYSEEMRSSIQNYHKIECQLRKILYEKQKEIQKIKIKLGSLQDKNRIHQKNASPLKQIKIDEKQYIKLKNVNTKIIMDNQRLSKIINQMDFKLYQMHKVNRGLNDTIINQDLQDINQRLRTKYQDLFLQTEQS